MLKTTRRYIGGGFLYLIYSSTIYLNFQWSVGYVLARQEAEEQIRDGIIARLQDYGWGGHYMWQLFAAYAGATCGAFICGAMAKRQGAIVSCIGNLPITLFQIYECYLVYTNVAIEHRTAWRIIYPLTIIVTVFSAVTGGHEGEEEQGQKFEEDTVLGIKPYHWFWIFIVGNIYILGICSSLMRFLSFMNFGFTFLGMIPYMFLWIPVLGYLIPVAYMYSILSGETLKGGSWILKFGAFLAIFIGGLVIAGLIEWICLKTLGATPTILTYI